MCLFVVLGMRADQFMAPSVQPTVVHRTQIPFTALRANGFSIPRPPSTAPPAPTAIRSRPQVRYVFHKVPFASEVPPPPPKQLPSQMLNSTTPNTVNLRTFPAQPLRVPVLQRIPTSSTVWPAQKRARLSLFNGVQPFQNGVSSNQPTWRLAKSQIVTQSVSSVRKHHTSQVPVVQVPQRIATRSTSTTASAAAAQTAVSSQVPPAPRVTPPRLAKATAATVPVPVTAPAVVPQTRQSPTRRVITTKYATRSSVANPVTKILPVKRPSSLRTIPIVSLVSVASQSTSTSLAATSSSTTSSKSPVDPDSAESILTDLLGRPFTTVAQFKEQQLKLVQEQKTARHKLAEQQIQQRKELWTDVSSKNPFIARSILPNPEDLQVIHGAVVFCAVIVLNFAGTANFKGQPISSPLTGERFGHPH